MRQTAHIHTCKNHDRRRFGHREGGRTRVEEAPVSYKMDREVNIHFFQDASREIKFSLLVLMHHENLNTAPLPAGPEDYVQKSESVHVPVKDISTHA